MPALVWFLNIGTGLSRAAFFLSMPFLAIHLTQKTGADAVSVGVIIGAGPIAGTLVGFYTSYLSDVFGRRAILVGTSILWSLVFLGFGYAIEYWQFFILNLLNGMFRAAFEPISQALLSDLTSEDQRTRAYHYRYFAINLGAVAGPLIGARLLTENPSLGFSVTAIVYFFYGLALWKMLGSPAEAAQNSESAPSFKAVIGVLGQDKALIYFLGAFFITSIAYSQIDSTLPILLTRMMSDEGIRLFGWILSTNAMTVVALQLLMNRATKNLPVVRIVAMASVVFGFGFIGFGFSGAHAYAYIVSMVVLTLGEILVFSNGYLLVDQLAPKNLKATYFGAINLNTVGFSVGPLLGGWALESVGGKWLYSVIGALVIASALLFVLGGRARKGDRASP